MSGSEGHKRFGNYEIVSLLGKGGMAEVYRAKVLSGPRQGWTVAIKRLAPDLAKDPRNVDLFASEADLSRLLDHPNIVKVYEVGVIGEIYFMVMEFIDGRDLAQVLKRCRQANIHLPVDFGMYVATVLLEALAYAHAAVGPSGKALGVVHCDVSPSNVFISRTGEVKLGDFGVARARVGMGEDGSLVAGKPAYVSPELLKGEITPDVDLWAATVTLYELLTLERPFVGANRDEIFAAVSKRRYKRVAEVRPEIPSGIETILAKGFARSAEERFRSAGEYAQSMRPLFDENVGTPLAIASVVRGLFGLGHD